VFGFVTAGWKELSREQQDRYNAVYCGICRELGRRCSRMSRLCLSYDMVFLALLELSLYEPEETEGTAFCAVHPFGRRRWTSSECICYAADMNAALACLKAQDDVRDDHKLTARWMNGILEPKLPEIRTRWPRQCDAMESCLQRLDALERAGSPDPDAAAGCFGELMAELMVMEEDCWSQHLRHLGSCLGRFIYLADAMLDYDADRKKGSYNPFLAAGIEKDPALWEQILVLTMAGCTEAYEKLPLVRDKALLDNILYSGVWLRWRGYRNKEESHGSGSL